MQNNPGFWQSADTILSVMVSISVLGAAVVAVIKFRLLNLFARRYRSELVCTDHVLRNGRIVFLGDYTIHNTGERPINLSSVVLRLRPAIRTGVMLEPDVNVLLAERILTPSDPVRRGLFQIEAGERSIFTLRCELPQLNDIVFLVCTVTWPDLREPAPYIGLHVPSSLLRQPVPVGIDPESRSNEHLDRSPQ